MAKQLSNELNQIQVEVLQARESHDEQKLKELKTQLRKEPSICGAVTGSGKLCTKPPVNKEDGSSNGRCSFHGGKSTGQVTDEGRSRSLANLDPQAAVKHGAFQRNMMFTTEEADLYNALMDQYVNDYGGDVFNLLLADRLATNYIKQLRLETADFLKESQSYNDFDSKIARFSELLGVNNKFKQQQTKQDNPIQVNLNNLFDFNN